MATLQTAIAWTLAIALVGGLLVLLIRAGRFLLTRWKSCSRSRVALEAFGVAVLAIVWVGMSQNVP